MKLFISLFISLLSFGAYAEPIDVSWTAPTTRSDGTTIDSPVSYRLYHVIDNKEQDTIELPTETTTYNIPEAVRGVHVFTISAVEHGLEGVVSAPAGKTIGGSRIGRITIIIE